MEKLVVTISKSTEGNVDTFDVKLESTNLCMRGVVSGLGGQCIGTMTFNEADMVKHIIKSGIPRFTYTVKEPGHTNRVMKVVASDELR